MRDYVYLPLVVSSQKFNEKILLQNPIKNIPIDGINNSIAVSSFLKSATIDETIDQMSRMK